MIKCFSSPCFWHAPKFRFPTGCDFVVLTNCVSRNGEKFIGFLQIFLKFNIFLVRSLKKLYPQMKPSHFTPILSWLGKLKCWIWEQQSSWDQKVKVGQKVMRSFTWQVLIKHHRRCKDNSEQRKSCSRATYVLVKIENTQVNKQMWRRETRQELEVAGTENRVLFVWRTVMEVLTQRRETWEEGCLGE